MRKVTFTFLIFIVGAILNLNCLFSQIIAFESHSIDNYFMGIHVIKIIDLDDDGDYDIVGGSQHTPSSTSKGIAWWRNEGGDPIQWTRFVVDNTYMHVMSIDVDKINDDESFDIVASSWENGTVCWWESSGDPTQEWTKHTIVSGWSNAHASACGDLDNDGKVDVVGISVANNKISVFYNDDMSTNSWDEQILTASYTGAHNATLGDINNDGNIDIIAGNFYSNKSVWWKNSGERTSWTENVIANSNAFGNSTLCDINLDGQLDIIGSAWYRNELSYWICDNILTNQWTKNVVSNNLGTVFKGIGTDIDKDGDIDIVVTSQDPGMLLLYYNNNFSFRQTYIRSSFSGGTALAVIDIDKDGDDDIIAGASFLGDLILFENVGFETGSAEIQDKNGDIRIYPNPSKGTVRIDNLDLSKQIKSINVYDITGSEVYSKSFKTSQKEINLDLTLLIDGVYLLNIETNSGFSTHKINISNDYEKK
ncbi:T9SS type A sorting domain-containing protein [Bacteroidota bacterium]